MAKMNLDKVFLVLLMAGLLALPAAAATTQVHVVKYASDGTTILAEQTLTYQQMRDTMTVLGDGTTHYYHQGPVFVDGPDEATEQALRWNPAEDANVLEKDMGAAMGTNVKDLCDLVGGMSPGDTLRVKASDGMTKDFAYENVYGYSAREGPIVLTWYTDFNTDDANPGIYPDTGYSDGMRLVWFADTTTNLWGVHAFGNWDWHEAAAPEYWYYYMQGGENYPTTTGLSVKYVSELRIVSSTGPVVPVAAFTSDKQSGTAPLTVQFTDESTGSPTAWAWDFTNDGTVDSIEPSPSHIYDTAGTYSVKLTVTNSAGSDDELKTDYITVTAAGPKTWYVDDSGGADFTTLQDAVAAASSGDTIFIWNGTYLGPANADLGINKPYLTIIGEGADVVTFSGNSGGIRIPDSGGDATGTVVGRIRFVNLLQGFPVGTLGPAQDSVIRDCIFEGLPYSVEIKGNNLTFENNTIKDFPAPEGYVLFLDEVQGTKILNNHFTNNVAGLLLYHLNGGTIAGNIFTGNGQAIGLYDPGTGFTIYQNSFLDNTVTVAKLWGWDGVFAGVWTSTSPIEYTYNGATYTGILGNYWGSDYTGTDADGNGIGDTAFAVPDSLGSDNAPLMGAWNNGEITYTPPVVIAPVAAFTSDVQTGTAPLTVQFTDASTGSPTAWAWDFGDGSTSTEQGPSHTYSTAGTYTVSLTATNAVGSDTETKSDLIVVNPMLVWGPYITGTTTTGTVINVKTGLPTAVTVDYATDAYYTANSAYDQSATGSTTDTLHHIALTGLEPDTLYHYQVTYGEQQTADLHFRTFPASGPITFVMYSDTQDQLPTFSQLERHKLVADRIAEEPDVAFVLNSGDLVNDPANMDDWDRYFAAGSILMANTTVFPARGNHDDNGPNYLAAYGVPDYYSFDCGDGHFVVLDSNDWADLAAEGAWLESDLQATEKPFRFVSFHYPPYTSEAKHFGGYTNIREEWEDEFVENDVLAVFNGHVHAYERFLANDVNYFVSGTGGGPAYNLADPRAPGSQNSLEYTLGYIRVTIDPEAGTATAEMIRVADVSSDLKSITTVYPPNTVFETMVMALNQPPVANAGPDPEVLVGETVSFDGSLSLDPDGTITEYAWDFGDGTTGTSMMSSHVFSTAGTYTVTLTVTDDDGVSASDSAEVTVITHIEGIEEITSYIESLDLDQGIENDLTATLDAAMKSLEKGHTIPAANQMNACLNKIAAQTGKALTVEQATFLTAEIQQIIDLL